MANTCVIKRDPANKQLVVEVIEIDENNVAQVVATAGRIVLDLDDLTASTAGYREAKFRAFRWKDYSAGCIEKEAYFLMTEPRNV